MRFGQIVGYPLKSLKIMQLIVFLSMKNPALNEAVKRIFPQIDMEAIEKIIGLIDCISEKRKDFYKQQALLKTQPSDELQCHILLLRY